MAHRVLVSDKLAPEGLAILRAAGDLEVDDRPGLSPAELLAVIADYDALVIRSGTRVSAEVIAAATRLRVIGRAGIGVDNVDVPAATRRGIVVMNTPGGNNVTTAEHALSLMLSLARFVPQADASLRSGQWERNKFTGTEITGKVLGVVGLGNIGRIVADRGAGLAMKVLGYDPFLTPENAPPAVELVSLDDLFVRSDFVTVHVPLTAETRNLIDAAAMARMKKGVRIINCARGGIVDEQDLAAAIASGKVAGAAFDVFVDEPPPRDHPLLALPNVVVTPHLGASTGEAQTNVAVAIADQVAAFLSRGAISAAVNMPPVTPEEREFLAPWLLLGEKLGSLMGQLGGGAPKSVEISYEGQVAERGMRTVTAAVLRGILVPILGDEVNWVSAPVVARERGIEVRETTLGRPSGFRDSVMVRVGFADGSNRLAAGAVFGNGIARLVRLDGFHLEAAPEGYILLLENRDVPGVVGRVGTLLGKGRVNIAGLQLGREKVGGRALSLFQIDEPVPEAVLAELRQAPEILSARLLHL